MPSLEFQLEKSGSVLKDIISLSEGYECLSVPAIQGESILYLLRGISHCLDHFSCEASTWTASDFGKANIFLDKMNTLFDSSEESFVTENISKNESGLGLSDVSKHDSSRPLSFSNESPDLEPFIMPSPIPRRGVPSFDTLFLDAASTSSSPKMDIETLLGALRININSISRCFYLYEQCTSVEGRHKTGNVSDKSNSFFKRVQGSPLSTKDFGRKLKSDRNFLRHLGVEAASVPSTGKGASFSIGHYDSFFRTIGDKLVREDQLSFKTFLRDIFTEYESNACNSYGLGFIDPSQYDFLAKVVTVSTDGEYESLRDLKNKITCLKNEYTSKFGQNISNFDLVYNEKILAKTKDLIDLELTEAVLEEVQESIVRENKFSYLFPKVHKMRRPHFASLSGVCSEQSLFVSNKLPDKLFDLVANPFFHSISNINKYVGDKWDEDFISLLVKERLPIEVCCVDSSDFKQLQRLDGYDTLIEFKSLHNGSDRYLATNMAKGESKFIVRIDLGESYKIHTIGQMLLFETYVSVYDAESVRDSELLFIEPSLQNPVLGSSFSSDQDASFKTDGCEFEGPSILSSNFTYQKDGLVNSIICHLYKDESNQLIAIQKESFGRAENDPLEEVALNYSKPKLSNSVVAGVPVIARRLDPNLLTIKSKPISDVWSEIVNQFKCILDESLGSLYPTIDILILGGEKEVSGLMIRKDYGVCVLNIGRPNFNAKIYKSKKNNKMIMSCNISPNFFGDRAGCLVEALIPLRLKSILLTGTSGALKSDLPIGRVLLPKTILDSDSNDFQFQTDFFGNSDFMESLSEEVRANYSETEFNMGVDSPIVESERFIETLVKNELDISSVDCEAQFISRVIKDKGIRFFPYFRVSDNPVKGQSISRGGHAEVETFSSLKRNKTEGDLSAYASAGSLFPVDKENFLPQTGRSTSLPPTPVKKGKAKGLSLSASSSPDNKGNHEWVRPPLSNTAVVTDWILANELGYRSNNEG